MVIDTLELRVPLDTPKNKEFWGRYPSKRSPATTPYLEMKSDAEPMFDVPGSIVLQDIAVHFGYGNPKMRRPTTYRVALTRARVYSAQGLISLVQRPFRLSASEVRELKVGRVDLAVDVPDVSMLWFRQHTRVRYKRKSAAYGVWNERTKASATTLMFGTRLDLYRIYDKAEEQRAKGWSGYPTNQMVTRVERQSRGRAVPAPLRTFGALLNNAADFDPFERLEFVCGQDLGPSPAWEPRKWLMCLGLKKAVDDYGVAEVRSMLNADGRNHAHRYFSRYSDFLSANVGGITREQLRDWYLRSASRQLRIGDEIAAEFNRQPECVTP